VIIDTVGLFLGIISYAWYWNDARNYFWDLHDKIAHLWRLEDINSINEFGYQLHDCFNFWHRNKVKFFFFMKKSDRKMIENHLSVGFKLHVLMDVARCHSLFEPFFGLASPYCIQTNLREYELYASGDHPDVIYNITTGMEPKLVKSILTQFKWEYNPQTEQGRELKEFCDKYPKLRREFRFDSINDIWSIRLPWYQPLISPYQFFVGAFENAARMYQPTHSFF